MTKGALHRFLLDARHWQITALSVLLVYSIAGFDFGASVVPSLVAIATTLAMQAACTRIAGKGPFDFRSPLITGLSLSLLLRTDALWVTALAAGLAIGSKYVLRIRGKHVWNPATFGIVVVLLGTHHVWISPGQWGASVTGAALIAFLAILVLGKATRVDTALAFLGMHAALLVARALWLGDPMTIPLHQLQSGSLLLFGCFMVTDPRTTPDRRLPRLAFAAGVAMLGHYLAFFMQMRPALYLSLAALAPLVPLLDLLFPAVPYRWGGGTPPQSPTKWGSMGLLTRFQVRPVRAAAVALAIAGVLAASATPSLAFCGFYVAQGDSKLFNKASKVVLARDGEETAITMASDYEGDPKSFALVIPVPVVVQKDQIHVVDPALVDGLDAYTVPRLTEYFDPNPCPPPVMENRAVPVAVESAAAPAAMAPKSTDALGVTIEARYAVGVYDILILSATESDGLVTWLKQNQYRIPQGAEDVLGSYIRQSMHFFVAKVNLERQADAGNGYLKPIQVRYQSNKFMLPIRLGTVNANGPQDLLLFTLTPNGRVEAANYRPAKMTSHVDVPLFVHDDFASVYKAAFDHAIDNDGMHSIFLEYAWPIAAYCDPCSGTPPTPEALVTLGAGWTAKQDPDAMYGNRGFITRLHIRYDREHFPEDLLLTETRDTGMFQVVYTLHHPYSGQAMCKAADDYRASLSTRFKQEAKNLAELTGWELDQITQRMGYYQDTAPNRQ